jgi:hypothetical protein
MEEVMKAMAWDVPLEGNKLKFIPDDKELDDVKAIGRKLGEHLKKK